MEISIVNTMNALSTEVTAEEIEIGNKDEFGVVYSPDGQRLLRCENESIEEYEIKNGTTVICDLAFNDCEYLQEITIPNFPLFFSILN